MQKGRQTKKVPNPKSFPSKVKPVVVKHVISQNFMQQPDSSSEAYAKNRYMMTQHTQQSPNMFNNLTQDTFSGPIRNVAADRYQRDMASLNPDMVTHQGVPFTPTGALPNGIHGN